MNKKITIIAVAVILIALTAVGVNYFLSSEDTSMGTSDSPQVTLSTTYGDIVLELYPEKAPETVKNFLAYVKEGGYDNTIFHRVIDGFMVQGGGFILEGDAMKQKSTNSPIQNEADNGLKNDRGTIAMARTGDPHSATNQFFINHKNNDFLNFKSQTPQGWGYAVFAKVIEGMDVIDKITTVKTGNIGGHGDVPLEVIVLNSAKLSG